MKKFMIHSAITILGDKGPVLLVAPNGKPIHANPDAEDKEICQYGAECKRGMPEHHFRKAFREMEEACLKKAVAAGLVHLK